MNILPPPDREDIESYIIEFTNNSESWLNQGLQSITRAFDLSVRNGDREFNLILSLTTLSAAFLAIVAPLIRESFTIALMVAVAIFLLPTLLGITILWITIKRDQRLIDADASWEHSVLQEFLRKSTDIRSDLYEYRKNPTKEFWEKINTKIDEYFNSRKTLNNDFESRQAQKEQEFSSKILRSLRKLFWTTFALAIVALVFWLGQEMITSFSVPPIESSQESYLP